MPEISIENTVVFVTGANRGIGRAIVEEALARGAKRVYAAARDVSGVSDLVAEYPERVVAIRLDVTKGEQIDSAASQAQDVQVLVNNAGVAGFSGFIEKETPRNAASRIFDQMAKGVEDITTDALADELVRNLKIDAKAVEKENAKMAHQPTS